ncbi:MAG: hypothetical protein R2699_18995 [Acidimicrobiales bacterium]
MRSPSTKVPLALPRSSTISPAADGSSSRCRRDTVTSSSTMPSQSRPTSMGPVSVSARAGARAR